MVKRGGRNVLVASASTGLLASTAYTVATNGTCTNRTIVRVHCQPHSAVPTLVWSVRQACTNLDGCRQTYKRLPACTNLPQANHDSISKSHNNDAATRQGRLLFTLAFMQDR